MAVVLNFGDLGCMNESASGSLGAGMASLARAGFPVARGFVVAPHVFADFLKRPEITAAMDMHSSGAESPEESWRALKAQFSRTRLSWSHEMEILTAFSGLGGTVSLTASARFGYSASMVYASSGEDLLAGIKHCWLGWLKANSHGPDWNCIPAVVVREIPDSDVSAELIKKGQDVKARVIFGLPEGLHDPAISPDIFEFGPEGKLDRMEMRPQVKQFIARGPGPARVPVAPDFREEEKLTGDMAAQLGPIIDFMRQNPAISHVTVCFVSSRPVIHSASMSSPPLFGHGMPPRDRSISLLEPAPKPARLTEPAPVLAMRMYLRVESAGEISPIADTYVDGVIITADPLAKPEWSCSFGTFAQEVKRKFRASETVIEISDTAQVTMQRLGEACQAISSAGMRPAVLIPGMRSPEELAGTVRTIKTAAASAPELAIWVKVMYPSNLYFMDSIAADVLALDTDSLGRLMLGLEKGDLTQVSSQALEKAMQPALASKKSPIAVISEDMVSMPTFLEFLVRNRADILCPRPRELGTVRHVVASVEKRLLMEKGG